jgi:hypothetical protein
VANSLLTIDMITREALRIAHEKLTYLGTIDRSYDDSFAKTGAKIGDTLRIRMPNQYTRRKGSRIMAVQDQNEVSQAVTVATQDGVDMKFNSAELALSIDDFSTRYIEPAMAVMVAGIEGDVMQQQILQVYQQTGTPGTVVGASGDISALTNARAKLNQQLAPKDRSRAVQLDSVTMGSVVNGLKTLFNDQTQVSEAFREGFYSRNAMADWYENEKTPTVTYGSTVTGNTNAAAGVTDAAVTPGGGTSIAMNTAIPVANQTVGSVFTIAGVYDVHPETKQAYPNLKQFVITGFSGNNTLISPTIYLTGPRQNVASSTGAQLGTSAFNSAATAWGGSASTSYRQNLMYHKDWATFVTADLPLMDNEIKCVRRVQDGLSMRVWQGSDIRNDELLMRLDILYGHKVLRPEWACRLTN